MDPFWIWAVVAALLALAGYVAGARTRNASHGASSPRNKKIVVTPAPNGRCRCTSITVPQSRTLSIGEKDTILWTVKDEGCLRQNPGAVVEIRFKGASPLDPPQPSDSSEIRAKLAQNVQPGKYSYSVWLKMPNEADSCEMEDPELVIEM